MAMENGNGEVEARLKDRFARLAQDRDDLNNEMAGRDVGRITRFFGGAATNSTDSQRRDKRRTAFETQLQIMMANAAYRALYEETAEVLNNAQRRIDAVWERVQALQEANAEALDAMESTAARLPDGEIVFRDRAGDVRHRDGRLVEAELAATILWRGDEPNFEDWQSLQERGERLEALEADARAGQARIGDLDSERQNDDDPPSVDALEAMQDEAEAIANGLETGLASFEQDGAATPEVSRVGPVGLEVPSL
ncbi:MAG: hypothetical protein AAFQ58_22735 [Pseudomonadota bacterium]